MTTLSFDSLYESSRERILALCLHLTGNRPAAEDAFQETFLQVHRHLATFRGDSDVSTWVYRIAIRIASRARARARARAAAGPAPLADPSSVSHPAPGTSPAALASLADDSRALYAALDRLDDPDRHLLGLLNIRGLPAAQIAAILDIPVGTVYSRAHHARKALAAQFAHRP